jgi:hypothetical protein
MPFESFGTNDGKTTDKNPIIHILMILDPKKLLLCDMVIKYTFLFSGSMVFLPTLWIWLRIEGIIHGML